MPHCRLVELRAPRVAMQPVAYACVQQRQNIDEVSSRDHRDQAQTDQRQNRTHRLHECVQAQLAAIEQTVFAVALEVMMQQRSISLSRTSCLWREAELMPAAAYATMIPAESPRPEPLVCRDEAARRAVCPFGGEGNARGRCSGGAGRSCRGGMVVRHGSTRTRGSPTLRCRGQARGRLSRFR